MRFSILTLFGVTAYVAVAIMGIVEPDSIWNSANVFIWILVLVSLAIKAFSSPLPQSRFAAATFTFTLIYCTAAVLVNLEYRGGHSMQIRMPLFVEHLYYSIHPDPNYDDIRTSQFVVWNWTVLRWALCNTSLAAGLLGGCLTLWRFRVLELRSADRGAVS